VTDDLDAKLARIGSRIEHRAAANRARMDRVPGLVEVAELARATFGAKLAYLVDCEGSIGNSVDRRTGLDLMQPGLPWTVYIPPKVRK
jgi:hypothetical protein